MITVKDQHQISPGTNLSITLSIQGLINISGFCRDIFFPGQVAYFQVLGQNLQGLMACQGGGSFFRIRIITFLDRTTVIKNKNIQFFPGIIEQGTGTGRDGNHLLRFVISGDEDIDNRQAGILEINRLYRTAERHDIDDHPHNLNKHAIQFCQKKQKNQDKFQR